MPALILVLLLWGGSTVFGQAADSIAPSRTTVEDGVNPSASPSQPFVSHFGNLPDSEKAVRQLPPPFNDPNKIWTLPELVDQALKRNPSTAQAWEQANSAAAQLGVQKAANYPTISMGANGGPSHTTSPTYPGYSTTNEISFTPQLQIQYTLLDFGTRNASQEQARFNLLSQNFNFNQSLKTMVLNVMTDYYNLDQAKAALKNAETSLNLAETTLQATQIKQKVGLGTSTDVATSEQNLQQARYNLGNAEGTLSMSQVQLGTSLGIPGTAELKIAPPSNPPSLAVLDQQVGQLVDQAFRQRPDIASKYNAWRAQLAAVNQAEAARWPALTVATGLQRTYFEAKNQGGFSSQGSFNGGGHFDSATATLGFTFTLFDGGADAYQIKSARALAEAAKADLLTTELGAISSVVTGYISFRTASRQVDAGQALLEASQKNYDATSIAYQHGLKTIIDVITAENNLTSAQATLSQARTSLFIASANLTNATGSMISPAKSAVIPPVISMISEKNK